MDFTYNRYKKLNDVTLELCNPDMRELGYLFGLNRAFKLQLNGLDSLTFEVPEFITDSNGKRVRQPMYDKVRSKRTIYCDPFGWFSITKVENKDDGKVRRKAVSCSSHEIVLQERGFYVANSVYAFYNVNDPKDKQYEAHRDDETSTYVPSVVGQLQHQCGFAVALGTSQSSYSRNNKVWTIIEIPEDCYFNGNVDSGASCRTFEEDEEAKAYGFLQDKVAEAFEVVFLFDYDTHTIRVKKYSDLTHDENVYLDFGNAVTNLQLSEDADDLVTVLTCTGQDLDITMSNPTGQKYITDFSYYMGPTCYTSCNSTANGALHIVANDATVGVGEIKLSDATEKAASGATFSVGDYVHHSAVEGGTYEWISGTLSANLANWYVDIEKRRASYESYAVQLKSAYEEIADLTTEKIKIDTKARDIENLVNNYCTTDVSTIARFEEGRTQPYNTGDFVVFNDGNGDSIYMCKLQTVESPSASPASWQSKTALDRVPFIAEEVLVGERSLDTPPDYCGAGDFSYQRYFVGERVMYNGKEYMCTTEHNSTATFTAAYWQEVQPFSDTDTRAFFSQTPTLDSVQPIDTTATEDDYVEVVQDVNKRAASGKPLVRQEPLTQTPQVRGGGLFKSVLGFIKGAITAVEVVSDIAKVVSAVGDAFREANPPKSDITDYPFCYTFAADAFDSSKTYIAGERVTYNGYLWVCHTSVSTAGAWTGTTNWNQANLSTSAYSVLGQSITYKYFVDNYQPASYCELLQKEEVAKEYSATEIYYEGQFVAYNYNGRYRLYKCINTSTSGITAVAPTTTASWTEINSWVNPQTSIDAEDNNAVYVTFMVVKGYYRYSFYANANAWLTRYKKRSMELDAQIAAKQSQLENNIIANMRSISNALALKTYLGTTGVDELQHYWFEGAYANDNLAATDSMSEAEKLEQAQQLIADGKIELEVASRPKYSFSLDCINLVGLYKFKDILNGLTLGGVVTVADSAGTLYYPVLTGLSFSLDSDSFSMEFANTLRPRDIGYTFADLASSGAKSARTVSSSWQDLIDYTNKGKDDVKSLVRNPLSNALAAAKGTYDANKAFETTDKGLIGREVLDDGTFGDKQIKILNNLILFTDDNWKSVRSALGEITYTDENGNQKTAYGIVGEAIVGKFMLGEKLVIVNKDGSVSIDDEGIIIKHGNSVVFQADSDGNVELTGTIHATSGEFSGDLEFNSASYSSVDTEVTWGINAVIAKYVVPSDGAGLYALQIPVKYYNDSAKTELMGIVNHTCLLWIYDTSNPAQSPVCTSFPVTVGSGSNQSTPSFVFEARYYPAYTDSETGEYHDGYITCFATRTDTGSASFASTISSGNNSLVTTPFVVTKICGITSASSMTDCLTVAPANTGGGGSGGGGGDIA